MGHSGPLPSHVLKLIAPDQRGGKDGPMRGNLGLTSEEAQDKYAKREEAKQIQLPFAQWLGLHGIPYLQPRSDKKSGIRVGWPDFTVLYGGKAVAIECKWPGCKLRPEQEAVRADLEAAGVPYLVAYSAAEAIAFVKEHLNPKLRT